MERLTEKREGRAWPRKIWSSETIAECIDRLAAYEETGLEPEEIQAIAGLASENCAKTADAIDKLLQDDAELKSYRELGPLDRLCELAQADQEGRCVILPVKPGDSVRFAKNPRAKNETVDAITIYPDGRMSFGFHEYGVKTEWVDRWSEDDACKYVPVESTEEALRREQDG